MPGLVQGIHVFSGHSRKDVTAGTSPAMTEKTESEVTTSAIPSPSARG